MCALQIAQPGFWHGFALRLNAAQCGVWILLHGEPREGKGCDSSSPINYIHPVVSSETHCSGSRAPSPVCRSAADGRPNFRPDMETPRGNAIRWMWWKCNHVISYQFLKAWSPPHPHTISILRWLRVVNFLSWDPHVILSQFIQVGKILCWFVKPLRSCLQHVSRQA